MNNKIVVIVKVPWERPKEERHTFWNEERDLQLWNFVHRCTTPKKSIDWKVIADTLGCSISECRERSRQLYSLKIKKLDQLESKRNDLVVATSTINKGMNYIFFVR